MRPRRDGLRRAQSLKPRRAAAVACAAALLPGTALAATVDKPLRAPADVARQLPAGFAVLALARVRAGAPARSFVVVALGRRDETARADGPAPARPLVIFEQRGDRFTQVGRNDAVVFKADEGGQCDPFLDGDAVIAAKGGYFTVQNGVACGEHWTDYVTFRFEERTGGFVFDNERFEAWKLNPRDDGDALVRDGPPQVTRAPAGAPVAFAAWRPTR